MKNNIFTFVVCGVMTVLQMCSYTLEAQHIFDFDAVDRAALSNNSQRLLDFYENKTNVDRVDLVTRTASEIEMSNIQLTVDAITTLPVYIFEKEIHDTGIQTYFGMLADETGIVFTEKNEMVIAKFHDGPTAVTILPLESNIHMVVRYGDDPEPLLCGVAEDGFNDVAQNRGSRDDDGCNIRILIGFSDDAVANIPGDLHLFAQSAIDESNLAFTRSDVDMKFEIATVRVFNMTENPTVSASPECRSRDLQRFFDNDAPFGNVNTYRGNYRSDLQILIVNQNIVSCSGGTLFGQVIAVGVSANNAYSICTLSGITDGRFSFTHELGHIMGARHENHGSNYNRGYVFGISATNVRRTIMARTGAANCSLTTSCRAQNFSNPDVNFGGVPTGVDDDFDNARWLDNNADDVQNYRENWGSVTVSPETIANNTMGNYSANSNITTSGAVVVNSGGELNFRAGNSVNINNGFTLNNGSTFGIVLGNCTVDQNRTVVASQSTIFENQLLTTQLDNGSNLSIQPNPMFDQAKVEFRLNRRGIARLTVADRNGNYLYTIQDEKNLAAGVYEASLSSNSLSPGLYHIILTLTDRSITQRFVVL